MKKERISELPLPPLGYGNARVEAMNRAIRAHNADVARFETDINRFAKQLLEMGIKEPIKVTSKKRKKKSGSRRMKGVGGRRR